MVKAAKTAKVGFNRDPFLLMETDLILLKSGMVLAQALRRKGYGFLLEHPKILRMIFFHNGIPPSWLQQKLKQPLALRLSHPKMYLLKNQRHPCFPGYRNRSFALFEWELKAAGMVSRFERLLRKPGARHEILEIGCGTGRALVELKQRLPAAAVHGICLPGERVSVRKVSAFFDLPPPRVPAPVVHELDLNQTSLAEHFSAPAWGASSRRRATSFDFVFSQASLRYIRDKIALIGETWSILRPGGFAALELFLLKVLDARGRELKLESFFNQKRWQRYFYYCPERKILFIFKETALAPDLSELQLIEAQTRYEPVNADPMKNGLAGWFSVYRKRSSLALDRVG